MTHTCVQPYSLPTSSKKQMKFLAASIQAWCVKDMGSLCTRDCWVDFVEGEYGSIVIDNNEVNIGERERGR